MYQRAAKRAAHERRATTVSYLRRAGLRVPGAPQARALPRIAAHRPVLAPSFLVCRSWHGWPCAGHSGTSLVCGRGELSHGCAPTPPGEPAMRRHPPRAAHRGAPPAPQAPRWRSFTRHGAERSGACAIVQQSAQIVLCWRLCHKHARWQTIVLYDTRARTHAPSASSQSGVLGGTAGSAAVPRAPLSAYWLSSACKSGGGARPRERAFTRADACEATTAAPSGHPA